MRSFFQKLLPGARLLLSAFAGVAVFFATPPSMQESLRGAIGWDVGAGMFLLLTVLAVGNATPERLRHRASQQDTKFWIILGIIVIAALASLASLAFVLQKQQDASGPPLAARIVVAAITLFVSWVFVHTAFAIHYAHYFYGDPEPKGQRRGGLKFPQIQNPDFWDFIYYSFVVGMTCQVSDVQVTSRAMRHLTLAHGVLSFFFNAGVLALAVNILATVL
jgi:uncharacterized membrane protein